MPLGMHLCALWVHIVVEGTAKIKYKNMVLLRRHNSHSLFLFPRLSSPRAVGVSTQHYRADVVAFLRPPKPIIPRLTLPRRDPFVPRRPGVKVDMPTIPIWPACHSVPEYTSKSIFLAFRSPRQFISPFDSTACFFIFLFLCVYIRGLVDLSLCFSEQILQDL